MSSIRTSRTLVALSAPLERRQAGHLGRLGQRMPTNGKTIFIQPRKSHSYSRCKQRRPRFSVGLRGRAVRGVAAAAGQSAAAGTDAHRALLQRYCVNSTTSAFVTGGLALEYQMLLRQSATDGKTRKAQHSKQMAGSTKQPFFRGFSHTRPRDT